FSRPAKAACTTSRTSPARGNGTRRSDLRCAKKDSRRAAPGPFRARLHAASKGIRRLRRSTRQLLQKAACTVRRPAREAAEIVLSGSARQRGCHAERMLVFQFAGAAAGVLRARIQRSPLLRLPRPV